MNGFLLNNKQRLTAVLSVLASVLLVGGVVYATTIGTNVNTGGTLTVTGAATLSSTLAVTGATTLSSTLAVTSGATLSSTLGVSGLSTLAGYISTASSTVIGGINTDTLSATGLSTLTGGFVSQASSTVVGSFNARSFIGAGGTSTPAAEFSASGSATTTLYMHSSGSKVGGCIELESTTGTIYRMYISPSEQSTTTSPGRTGVIAMWESGSCK